MLMTHCVNKYEHLVFFFAALLFTTGCENRTVLHAPLTVQNISLGSTGSYSAPIYWSGDGNEIFYTTGAEIVSANVSSKQQSKVVSGLSQCYQFQLSTKSDLIYFASLDPGTGGQTLQSIPTTGGSKLDLLPNVESFSVSANDSVIAYRTPGSDTVRLYFVTLKLTGYAGVGTIAGFSYDGLNLVILPVKNTSDSYTSYALYSLEKGTLNSYYPPLFFDRLLKSKNGLQLAQFRYYDDPNPDAIDPMNIVFTLYNVDQQKNLFSNVQLCARFVGYDFDHMIFYSWGAYWTKDTESPYGDITHEEYQDAIELVNPSDTDRNKKFGVANPGLHPGLQGDIFPSPKGEKIAFIFGGNVYVQQIQQ